MYASLLLVVDDLGDAELLLIAFGIVSLVLLVVVLWPDKSNKPAVSQPLSSRYVAEELRALQQLRNEGKMSEEQFEAEKKRLLQE
jgi:uncharacterized membrane protein YqjE